MINLNILVFMIGSILGAGALGLPNTLVYFRSCSGIDWPIILYLLITSGIFCGLSYIFGNYGENYLDQMKQRHPQITKIIFMTYWISSVISTIVIINELIVFLAVLGLVPNFLVNILLRFLLIVGFTYVNTKDSSQSLMIESIISMLKLGILLVIPFIILIFGSKQPGIVQYNNQLSLGNTLKAVSICSFSFLGVEIGASIKEKNKNFTMVASIVLCSIIYIINLMAIYSLGNIKMDAQVYARALGSIIPYGDKIMATTIGIVLLGSLNSWIWAPASMAYDGATNGLMPKVFQESNKDTNVPTMSLYISSGLLLLGSLIVTSNSNQAFYYLISICDLGFFAFYTFVCYCYGQDKNYFGYIIGAILLIISLYILLDILV